MVAMARSFERATPDFQAKLGYEVDKPGEADMTIASNAVRQPRHAGALCPFALINWVAVQLACRGFVLVALKIWVAVCISEST